MDAHDQEIQQKENRTTADRNREDQNAPITVAEKQPWQSQWKILLKR